MKNTRNLENRLSKVGKAQKKPAKDVNYMTDAELVAEILGIPVEEITQDLIDSITDEQLEQIINGDRAEKK